MSADIFEDGYQAAIEGVAMRGYTYTCTGCDRRLDPDQLEEYGHVCGGWWDDHGIYDEMPKIAVASESTDSGA